MFFQQFSQQDVKPEQQKRRARKDEIHNPYFNFVAEEIYVAVHAVFNVFEYFRPRRVAFDKRAEFVQRARKRVIADESRAVSPGQEHNDISERGAETRDRHIRAAQKPYPAETIVPTAEA